MLPADMIAKVSPFLTALLALLFLGASHASAEPQCVASFRDIKFPDGSARVKNYVCKTEGASKPVIRVEFDRLSEAAAGSLIMGDPYPDMDRAFGKVRVIDNAVATEARAIFDQFGTKKQESTCFAFVVGVAAGGKEYTSKGDVCGERRLTYLTFPDQMGFSRMEIPIPADIRHYQTSADWPPGYNFHYGPDCKSPISCTLIWRPARSGDLTNFAKNLAIQSQMAGIAADTPDELAYWENNPDSWHYQRKRYFALVDYLTREGWPDDFLIITGRPPDCGGGLDFTLHFRQMILDVAFVQNVSDQPVSIVGLLGSELSSSGLRQRSREESTTPTTLPLTDSRLLPGDTIGIPLAISFVTGDSLSQEFGKQETAEKAFKRIQSAKPGTIFKLSDDPSSPIIRKSRESFRAPSLPNPAIYVFGPEIRLGGIVVDGKQIVFDQASRNFMQLMAGDGYGSCPYLYAWDDGDKTWVRHGKVIDAANNKNKEMTETKSFDGFRSKFRLAEEELEISYIDHVKLEIELKGGGGMTLAPDFAAMSAKDGDYATIKAGDRIEFSFALPPSVKAENVKRSTLAITGYYRRYSDLFMARK